MRRSPWSCFAALVTILVVAGPASAAFPPTTVRNSGTFEEPARFDCGTFQLDGVWNYTSITTTFYDGAGDPYYLVGHLDFKGTLTNSVTGKVIDDSGHYQFKYHLATLDNHQAGTRHDTAPGYGVVFNDSGIDVEDDAGNTILLKGPTDLRRNDTAELCAYMAL